MTRRGPNTQRGKAASSRNAIKHGLTSEAPVTLAESHEEWQRHLDGVIAAYEPVGYVETLKVERIASLFWRLRRAVRYETEMIDNRLNDIPDDLATAARYGEKALAIPREQTITEEKVGGLISSRLLPPGDTLARIMKYEAHLHRMLTQTEHELEALQARRKGERTPLARLDISGPPSA